MGRSINQRQPLRNPRRTRAPRRRSRLSRRGVASVLAMMFVVMFGSLAAAMAIVSKGNIRTAQTHLHVNRAMGAAETGLAIARQKLMEAASRFIISKGTIDLDFGPRLWNGTMSSGDGEVDVLPPPSGFTEAALPGGIAQALVNAHTSELNTVALAGAPAVPEIHSAPAGADAGAFQSAGWITTPAIAVDGTPTETGAGPAAFQITYAPLADGVSIRVYVTGYSSITELGSAYSYSRVAGEQQYRPVSRSVQQDFQIAKRPDHAVLSPSRIMIGKNVLVNGKLGARYDDVAQNDGHPITIRSDFMSMDDVLDSQLESLYIQLLSYDVDGDNRLRMGHAVEGGGIPINEDFDGNGEPDGAFEDVTSDGYLDEFDVFINRFDTNGDNRVALSTDLTAGTPADGQPEEFTLDEDMSILLDSALPDRNRNGVHGWQDDNGNGRWDSGEALSDFDAATATYPDRVLGYRDGFIDRKDRYAKVRGRLVFKVDEDAWSTAQGDYRQFVKGSIAAGAGQSPVEFSASDRKLPEVTNESFTSSQTPLRAAADGDSFESQLALQLGVATTQLPTYVEADTDPSHARFWRGDLDDAYVYSLTGRHLYEKMPFNSPLFTDWYYRPRYENMAFKNVQIPRGTNALFINCTFVGVTYVRSYNDNTHTNWSLYGKLDWNQAQARPILITEPLDKSDFLRYTTGNPADGPGNYDEFPDPPVIDGVIKTGLERDTKLYSNNLRFHDCLFVGSIVSDTPSGYTHVRNKFCFTGGTRFVTEHPAEPANPDLNPEPDDLEEINKSSMMLPNYSVDIGAFNSPTDTFVGGPPPHNVHLQGMIVAGVIDLRGTTTVDGTLMLTFAPVAGEGPLQQYGQPVGNPAGFNATLGYFGPDDGDGEALDPETLTVYNGQRIVGWDLDGDGLPDLNHDQIPTAAELAAGATPIPFYGYGRITLNWDPDRPMPDGIMLPVSAVVREGTYKEGH
ncbi:MAG: hypothetical protein H7Y88_01825 [Phycisphaerales bacterium]|nr:hypothetical protein [Phycisphaerales bacterium]